MRQLLEDLEGPAGVVDGGNLAAAGPPAMTRGGMGVEADLARMSWGGLTV